MIDFIKKLIAFGFIAYMSVIGLGIVAIGGLFAWNLLTYERAEATFEAPNGRWSLRIEDSCLTGACYKYPKVMVPTGWFSSYELQCDVRGIDTSRVLFDDVRSAEWSDGDTVLAWTAGDPPERGRIDLRKDCYITAAFDDRPASTGLRFKENCLIDGCWRSVDWVESRGGYVYTTPCRVSATGNERVFTEPNDATGQIDVTLDAKNRRAEWTSLGTGQTGVIDFQADCDTSRQTRHEQPA